MKSLLLATRKGSLRGSLAGLGLVLFTVSACSSSEDDPDKDHSPTAGQGATGGASAGSGTGGAVSKGGGAGQGGSTAGTGTGGAAGSATMGGAAGTNAAGGGGNGGQGGSSGSAPGGMGGNASGAGGVSNAGGPAGGQGGSAGGSTEPAVHFVGRVDTTDPNNAKFAWSGTGVTAHFNGTEASALLSAGQQYTVVVDGMVQPKLTATSGKNALATGLAAGEHTVELYRQVEASQGVSTFMGFDFGSGTLLAPTVPTRRLEVVGDSITCGYGDEGADMNCPFSPDTENHYIAYPALTARALGAELSTVAWSGKGVVCNYGDAADACQNPMPTYYDRTLPDDANSKWDFSRFVADAVVVNLGTNDFSTDSDPTKEQFESAYETLLQRIRTAYPNAYILCTNGPMLSGTDLSTLMGYIDDVVAKLADAKISSFDITPQDGSDGYGCDWHPSAARHEKVASVVTAELKAKLGW